MWRLSKIGRDLSEVPKKATFNLHHDVLAAMDKAISEGAAPSKNVLVERALVKELKELRRQARQDQWKEGAKDRALLKDITDTENAFQFADAETANQRIK